MELFQTGFSQVDRGVIVMLLIGATFIYLGIARKMEPLLLVPIGFGMVLVNLPLGDLMSPGGPAQEPGVLYLIFHNTVANELVPALIFLGLGSLTDFGPVIANPRTLLLGAAAQLGVYFVFFAAIAMGFTLKEAASVSIIGGADGPTTIFLTAQLAPHLLGVNAVAAYSYMALVPLTQPPIIRLFTTKAERKIHMKPQIREVSTREKILFPIIGAIVIILLVPKSAPLIGMFMFGNLLRVSGVTDRLARTAGESFMDILTILLGITVGASMPAQLFLRPDTLKVFFLGVIAFAVATAGGVLMAKLMNRLSREPINPMIGAAGVSAVPMAARVVQRMGQQANPKNFLLMHAMGPNIAGVIGTAVAAGVFLSMVR
jgi:oxaloacetate decarboxylase beta subunit